jgi:hypothetical protein
MLHTTRHAYAGLRGCWPQRIPLARCLRAALIVRGDDTKSGRIYHQHPDDRDASATPQARPAGMRRRRAWLSDPALALERYGRSSPRGRDLVALE